MYGRAQVGRLRWDAVRFALWGGKTVFFALHNYVENRFSLNLPSLKSNLSGVARNRFFTVIIKSCQHLTAPKIDSWADFETFY